MSKLEAIGRAPADHPVTGLVKPKAQRWEVEPGVYQEAPSAGHRAIFQGLQAFTDGTAKRTGILHPHPNFEQAAKHYGYDPEELHHLMHRYNAGERWTEHD